MRGSYKLTGWPGSSATLTASNALAIERSRFTHPDSQNIKGKHCFPISITCMKTRRVTHF